MAESTDFTGPAEWSRDTAALRALARTLVRDEHAAEDAVQDTWLRALARGPAGASPPRRWLAAVLRNVVRDELKTGARRTAREIQAARGEATPSAEEIAHRH